jgi:ABC-type phosphate/phosphonate transport system substrate-binding protein
VNIPALADPETSMTQLDVSFPMYNLPEMASAYQVLWDALVDEMEKEGVTGLPPALNFRRPPVPDAIGPEVFFSQTCGYPLQTIFRGQYELLGVPTYDAPGCVGATHCAFVLVREDSHFRKLEDLRGGVFAVNSWHSNSGMNLPRALLARYAGGKPFFRSVIETGGHPPSMERVVAGEADAASIDCVTFAFFQDYRPSAVASLRILAETPPSPAIPFVTSRKTAPNHVATLRRSLVRVASDPLRRETLAKLRIRNIGPADPAAYPRILDYERDAARLGYPELV